LAIFNQFRNKHARYQEIWIYDCQKRRGIPVSPSAFSDRFGKKVFKTDEGEYLAIIFALEQPEYKNTELEIFTDSQPTIDVLNGKGRVSTKAKPYAHGIPALLLLECNTKLVAVQILGVKCKKGEESQTCDIDRRFDVSIGCSGSSSFNSPLTCCAVRDMECEDSRPGE
jgi:hypothetical protein